MMNFIADLHIHSRFSRATSRSLSVPTLAAWAACKGIGVLGSGDFTHPAWRKELKDNLLFEESSGLYKVNCPLEFPLGAPENISTKPLFCLQTEISSIYKRGGQTRKVHNLVFMPDLEAVEKFCKRLELIGNLKSDGRPILGLDSRDLLEIVLECSEDAVLIPAHIWTPWFSLFGSKSGFDSLEECFGDLSAHIFALETGLSSDPDMNRLLSSLDNYALVSNSDAHSGANLGREANLFAGNPSYKGIFAALRVQAKRRPPSGLDCNFLGTMEFYPEEGKYHLDGHRACNVSLEPGQSRELGNICPVCGKPLTIGVLHRVMELADREAVPDLELEPEAKMLIPLTEVLAEIYETGSSSKRVQEAYNRLLHDLGPELDILCEIPNEDIYAFWEPLGEAISRMRQGNVVKNAGFDGQYGKIRVFSEDDLRQFRSGNSALLPGLSKKSEARPNKEPKLAPKISKAAPSKTENSAPFSWSVQQIQAIEAEDKPIFVAAGPGAGKTRVLIGRITRLLQSGLAANKILAITFTRRAAEEMRERLAQINLVDLPRCDTLHALAHALRKQADDLPEFVLLSEEAAKNLFAAANPDLDKKTLKELSREIEIAHEQCRPLQGAALKAFDNYQLAKKIRADFEYLDYNDLLLWLLQNSAKFKDCYAHILVDEIQDFSPLQLEIVRRLLPENGQGFFGIGDPDQAIYGFRGISGQSEESLKSFWPELTIFRLNQSFRSSQKILDLARRALAGNGQSGGLEAVFSYPAKTHLFWAQDAEGEANWIAQKIHTLLGATSHTLQDQDSKQDGILAPSEIAVLVRLKVQIPLIANALERAGIPCQAPATNEFWKDESCASFIDLVGANLGLIPKIEVDLDLPILDLDTKPKDILNAFEKCGAKAHFRSDLDLFSKGSAFKNLCNLWKKCANWKNFFEELAWLNEAELIAAKAEKVRLLTLHSSKGLEFDAVFLPGLEDGLMPFKPNIIFAANAEKAEELPNINNMDEERRLLYVGLTRAAKLLYCSLAHKRKIYGQNLTLAPSPFLANMQDLLQQSRLKRHTTRTLEALPLMPGIARGSKK